MALFIEFYFGTAGIGRVTQFDTAELRDGAFFCQNGEFAEMLFGDVVN